MVDFKQGKNCRVGQERCADWRLAAESLDISLDISSGVPFLHNAVGNWGASSQPLYFIIIVTKKRVSVKQRNAFSSPHGFTSQQQQKIGSVNVSSCLGGTTTMTGFLACRRSTSDPTTLGLSLFALDVFLSARIDLP